MFTKDSIKNIDSLSFKTPKGKIVYGGGGIVPDVFVPLDTVGYIPSFYFKELNDFSFKYVDENRATLSKINVLDFIKDFDTNNVLITKFLNKIKGNNLPKPIQKKLKNYLKTTIARDLFSDEGLYRVLQNEDKMIKKVFELEDAQ